MKNHRSVVYVERAIDGRLTFQQNSKGRVKAIYPSPDLYEIHAENYTMLSQREARMALRTFLPTVLPGNSEDYTIDIRTRRFSKNEVRAVALILRSRDLAEIRKHHHFAPLAFPVAVALLEGREGNHSFYHGDRLTGFHLDSDTAILDANGPVFTPQRKKDELYFLEQRIKRPQKQLIAASSALLVLSTVALITHHFANEAENRLNSVSVDHRQLIKATSRRTEAVQKLAAEEAVLAALQANSPVSPYALLSQLVEVLPSGTDLDSMIIKGDRFTIRGRTTDTLTMVRQFEDNPFFSESQLDRVLPDSRGKGEIFIFAARFHGR